jgi:RNA polymerase sigma-70 factor (ECF subfamily)
MDRLEQFLRNYSRLIARLYEKAQAARWNVPQREFVQALHRSADERFREKSPEPREVAAYLESLYVEDLALACACTVGNEQAWEHFVAHFRPQLYAAACAIAGQSTAHELADTLYADLYGVEQRAGRPRSLFSYFHGRSKLLTWLRAILAQRYVDGLRQARRIESLEDDKALEAVADPEPAPRLDPDRDRYLSMLQAALTEALAALNPRDRLRLAYYYVQQLTLAQIGRLMSEHEATVSRKLARTERWLRQQVDSVLRSRKRMSEAQIRLCFEYAMEEWPFDLTKVLTQRE